MRAYLLLSALWVFLWFLHRAGGRLAPRATFAPLLFLVSRWPVLVAWGVGATGMLALLWPTAVARGKDQLGDLLLLGGLSAFCGLGFAALVVGPVWMAARALAPAPALPLEPDERVLYESLANHFLKGEARGGKLVVTSRRIGFRPHRFNVQLDAWSAPLEDIRALDGEGDRMLLVGTKGSPEAEWLVVPRRDALADYLARLAELPEEERAKVVF